MNNKLHIIFDQLESDRNELLSLLATQPEQKLRESPANGRWTILHIIAHLIASEKLSLAYMKKKSLGIDALDNSGIVEAAKMIILKLSQRIPFKFKAPKAVIDHTEQAQSLYELKIQWDTLRSDLNQFLESISDSNIRKKIYKHPVAGRLDCAQALVFFREHFYHHYPQIKRLL